MGSSSLSRKEIGYIEGVNRNRDIITDTAKSLIEAVERGELEEVDCTVEHRFSPGLYLREIFMPAGTRIIGKIHATEHFNIVLTGSCTMITAEGIEEIKAPYTFISKAGIQKCLVIHEDCVWQTTHVTDSKDVEEIEKQVIVECYDNLINDDLLKNIKRAQLCHGD